MKRNRRERGGPAQLPNPWPEKPMRASERNHLALATSQLTKQGWDEETKAVTALYQNMEMQKIDNH